MNVTNHIPLELIHSLASSADLIVPEHRARFVGHVGRFEQTVTSIQPLNDLLWYVPQGATRRMGQGARLDYLTQIIKQLDSSLEELKSKACGLDRTAFTAWTDERSGRPVRMQPELVRWASEALRSNRPSSNFPLHRIAPAPGAPHEESQPTT